MRKRILAGTAAAAGLAAPALAHVGDHGATGFAHHLAEHGVAAGLVALAIIAAAAVVVIKRKG